MPGWEVFALGAPTSTLILVGTRGKPQHMQDMQERNNLSQKHMSVLPEDIAYYVAPLFPSFGPHITQTECKQEHVREMMGYIFCSFNSRVSVAGGLIEVHRITEITPNGSFVNSRMLCVKVKTSNSVWRRPQHRQDPQRKHPSRRPTIPDALHPDTQPAARTAPPLEWPRCSLVQVIRSFAQSSSPITRLWMSARAPRCLALTPPGLRSKITQSRPRPHKNGTPYTHITKHKPHLSAQKGGWRVTTPFMAQLVSPGPSKSLDGIKVTFW